MKWADETKSHDAVLAQVDETPLFGVTTEKKRAVVKWWVFHKPTRQTQHAETSSGLVAATDGGEPSGKSVPGTQHEEVDR
jgi:hypothetical protein